MKHIKTYERYYNDEIMHYRYLNLQLVENGNLKISLNDEGTEKAQEDGIDEVEFYEFFEDVEGNSDYKYFDNLGESGLGMSDAPCIVDGYYYGDDGETSLYEDSEIFMYYDYYKKDFTKELLENGYVIFQTINPRTLQEIEEYRLQKDIKKYNL